MGGRRRSPARMPHTPPTSAPVPPQGFEGITRDLCNIGQNLCDSMGHLLHLALTSEARRRRRGALPLLRLLPPPAAAAAAAVSACSRRLARVTSSPARPLPSPHAPEFPLRRLPLAAAQYLSCPFPRQLAALTRLEQLDLTMNDLSGTVHEDVAAGAAGLPERACRCELSYQRSTDRSSRLASCPRPSPVQWRPHCRACRA